MCQPEMHVAMLGERGEYEQVVRIQTSGAEYR
jgi:hypothetical protein